MILLVTYLEEWVYNPNGSKSIKLKIPYACVSHGVCMETGRDICLPQEDINNFKDKIKIGGEWYV